MDKMYYIDFGGNGVEYTVKEDLKILFKTITGVLKSDGAV